MDHMGKMLCIYDAAERNLYITSVYLYINIFPGIRNTGKNLIDQIRKLFYVIRFYKIVQIYTLTGDLGVGKTVFTQGVAAGLGITEPVNSPTFTIIQEYEDGRLPFYHFDVYRIADLEEMEEIGYDDYFFGQGICLIEWAELIEEILPEKRIEVTIEKDLDKGFDYRKITIEERGEETK